MDAGGAEGEVTVEELVKNAGIEFDPELIKIFMFKV